MASIKEIAQLAKVSQSTVSVVLNGKGTHYRISTDTQQRIMDAAQNLGYRPNISARRLRTRGETIKPVIALFWTADTRSQLIARYLNGLQVALSGYKDDYEILIQPYVGAQIHKETSLLTGTRFNGAIIANSTMEDERYLESAEINVPTVLYLRNSEKYCSVNVDDYRTGRTIAELFASRGHRSVGIMMPIVSSAAIQSRSQGFFDGCKELGLEIREAYNVQEEYSEEGGYRGGKKIAAMGERPDAIFFLSDQMAIGSLYAFYEAGVRIPIDMEIVGHDDEVASKFSIPPLTTVHLPVEEMALACLELMDGLMTNQIEAPVARKFESHLVVRQTCGDMKQT
ncbi:LacI family DNA-binding transcriptional regulator [Paenibacillus sp. IB182496]|uniref:LacI family DNA-binding transcriptional regulator n=1 Tax=Paenibacillus sabuli TaxID=2772509 RepID=A0A927GTT0_9BACL|nr:LacI family DNA-binding transcriptional regulator [Paenibacillus sabuli]MBD2847425.1 LacI family DNA-binding transcriptional regulator [Paenibacillus sabuli]